jgi:hypothetical protein
VYPALTANCAQQQCNQCRHTWQQPCSCDHMRFILSPLPRSPVTAHLWRARMCRAISAALVVLPASCASSSTNLQKDSRLRGVGTTAYLQAGAHRGPAHVTQGPSTRHTGAQHMSHMCVVQHSQFRTCHMAQGVQCRVQTLKQPHREGIRSTSHRQDTLQCTMGSISATVTYTHLLR